MTSLHDLQTRILDALLNTSADSALSLIDAPAAGAGARLAVYRNTIRSNWVQALHSTYPAVRRLVGDDYFRQVAREFGHRHPSRSGDLRHVGELFPAYLAEVHSDDEYRYLGDVARLEFLIQEVLLAPDHAPLDLASLATVATAPDDLLFMLHPALRPFESPFPVQRIWQSNVGSDAEPEILDLALGGDRLVVLRRRLQLQFHPLSRGEWCFLSSLGRGARFAAAVESADASDDEFDAARALQRLVGFGAIVGFQ